MSEVIKRFLDKGFLVNPEFLNKFPSNFDSEEFFNLLNEKIKSRDKPLVIDENLFLVIKDSENLLDLNWTEFERAKTSFERGKDKGTYRGFLNILNYNLSEKKKKVLDKMLSEIKKPELVEVEDGFEEKTTSSVIVLNNYQEEFKKRDIQDFVCYFRNRYEFLKNILRNRPELSNVSSINRIKNKERSGVSIIGLVRDKRVTKNNNIMLTLEDLTGDIKVFVSVNSKEDLYEVAQDIVLDEVIGISGVVSRGMIFVNQILFPDVPNKGLKKTGEEVYAVFTSDIHLGSKVFFRKEFLKFIDWLNCKSGSSEQREIAKKVKYLFIAGDVVEGVGVYPEQEKDLAIKDIYEQYNECFNLLSKIRKDVNIIICGGNHDALRLSEPQPILDKEFTKDFYELQNLFLVTNPSVVNIHSSKNFPGFDVMLYHGSSFFYLAENVESVRKNGRIERADLIMKFLLQKRHLAPSHGASLYIPDVKRDPLVIDRIPDFFISGHIHKTMALDYKGVTMINAGCWIDQTENQEKRGIVPDPCKVILANLKNRNIKILNFRE